MEKILVTCPYMLPYMDRFRPILNAFGYETIEPQVTERFEAEDILKYAHQFVGTLCGDDRYTREVQLACLPELKVISKWGTGIDSIDQDSRQRTWHYGWQYPWCFYRTGYREHSGVYVGFCPSATLDGQSHEGRRVEEDPGQNPAGIQPGV